MIYLCIFTTIGFIVIMAWVYWLLCRVSRLEKLSEKDTTLSDILLKWDEAYANSDKHQKRKMTIDRQRYGIKTAAEMHGIQ